MDKKIKNKMDDMEMDKVSGGRRNPGGGGKNPCPGFHDGSANSMAANVDETQNARWREIGKIKPD